MSAECSSRHYFFRPFVFNYCLFITQRLQMTCPNVTSLLRSLKQLVKRLYSIMFFIRKLWDEKKIKRLRGLNLPWTGVSQVCQTKSQGEKRLTARQPDRYKWSKSNHKSPVNITHDNIPTWLNAVVFFLFFYELKFHFSACLNAKIASIT